MANTPMEMPFGERLYNLRINKGLKESRDITQELASEEMMIHVNSLRKYETSKPVSIPKLEQLSKIRNYYEVSYEYLLGETNNKQPREDYKLMQKETALSDEAIEMLKQLIIMKSKEDPSLQCHYDLIFKTINYFLANEQHLGFFENIGRFIWEDYEASESPIKNNKDLAKLSNEKLRRIEGNLKKFVYVVEKSTGKTEAIPVELIQETRLRKIEEIIKDTKKAEQKT